MQLSSGIIGKSFGLALFAILVGGSKLEARIACGDGEPEPFCECVCRDIIDHHSYYEIRKWWDEGGEQMCEDLASQPCRTSKGDGFFRCGKIYACPEEVEGKLFGI